MKKIIVTMMMLLALISCRSGGSSAPAPVNVDVVGSITNEVLTWQNYVSEFMRVAYAAPIISTRSNLVVNNPERLPIVSIASGIAITAKVINNGATPINGFKVDISIEDEQQLTPELWTCNVCYDVPGGQTCQAVYEFPGETLFEEDSITTPPACNVNAGQHDVCVTIFPEGINCAEPSYSVEYKEAGDGLQKFTGDGLSIAALSSSNFSVSQQSGGWPTGTDKYARFSVYNAQSILVRQKDYVFNVIE